MQSIRLVRLAMPLRLLSGPPPTFLRPYTSGSHIPELDPKKVEVEEEKYVSVHDKVHETINHAPGWNETLASVKADKEDLSNITIEELQTKTIKKVKEKYHYPPDKQ